MGVGWGGCGRRVKNKPPPQQKNPLEILMLGCGFGVGGGFAFGVVLSSAFPFRFVFRFCFWFRLGVWSLSGLVLASLLVSCLPLPLIFVCFALAFGLCFGSGLSAGVSFGFSFAFASPWGFAYASTFGFGSSSRFGVGLAFASLFAFLAVSALTLPLLCGLVFWLWDWI